MEVLRSVFWCSAIWNFRLKAVFYPGVRNVLADAVSRLETPGGFDRLMSLLPKAFLL